MIDKAYLCNANRNNRIANQSNNKYDIQIIFSNGCLMRSCIVQQLL